MTSPATPAQAATNTRTRLLATARQLFALHSFAGTSLQMIADRLGVTKAAVYHHFKTRDEILGAVIEPAIEDLRAIITGAEAQRGHTARAERMLTGFVDLTVRHRELIALLSNDPGVAQIINTHPDLADLMHRPLTLLSRGDEADPSARITASVVLSGIAMTAASPLQDDLDDETLRRCLLDTGRRALGLRRRPAA